MKTKFIVSFGVTLFIGTAACYAGPSRSRTDLKASIAEGFADADQTEKAMIQQGGMTNGSAVAKKVRHKRDPELLVVIESENVASPGGLKAEPKKKKASRSHKKLDRLVANEIESAH